MARRPEVERRPHSCFLLVCGPTDMNVTLPKSLKLNKEFPELAKNATSDCGKLRRERRSYILGETTNLVALIQHVPAVLAPKFPVKPVHSFPSLPWS